MPTTSTTWQNDIAPSSVAYVGDVGDGVLSGDTVAHGTTPGADPVWFDDFSSGDLSYTANGFSWGGSVRTSIVDQGGGNYALSFPYLGDTDPLGDYNCEQHFTQPTFTGQGWYEWRLFIPANYAHRDGGGGSTNNKMHVFWAGNYGPPGNYWSLATHTLYNSDAAIDSNAMRWVSQSYKADGSTNWPVGTPGKANMIGPTGAMQPGNWHTIGLYFKSASAAQVNDGRAELWIDGTLWFDLDWAFWANGNQQAFLEKGYLMGWANSGYDEDTTFLIDYFKGWDTAPGWWSTS